MTVTGLELGVRKERGIPLSVAKRLVQLLGKINGSTPVDPETAAQQARRVSFADRSREDAQVDFYLTGPPL